MFGGGLGWVWGLLVAALAAVSGLGVRALLHWRRDHLSACALLGKDSVWAIVFTFCCGKCT